MRCQNTRVHFDGNWRRFVSMCNDDECLHLEYFWSKMSIWDTKGKGHSPHDPRGPQPSKV